MIMIINIRDINVSALTTPSTMSNADALKFYVISFNTLPPQKNNKTNNTTLNPIEKKICVHFTSH